MTSIVTGRSLEFGSEDYDAIERAVMETPRGRWFLTERDRRQRIGETQRILDALKKLEGALAALPVQPAPVSGTDVLRAIAAQASASSESAAPAPPSMKNLKYFKQEEAIFTPAEPAAPKLAAVETTKPAPAPKPAEAPPVAKGARLIVNRVSPAGIEAPAAEAKPAEPATSPPPEPAAAESSDKRRIVIIRRTAAEPMDIPLHAELAASLPMANSP